MLCDELKQAMSSMSKSMIETEAELRVTRQRPSAETASERDKLVESLERFLAKYKPTMNNLESRHQALQGELASLLSFFGEGPDAKVEALLGTISAFSVDLKEAAAWVVRDMSGAKAPTGRPVADTRALLDATARRGGLTVKNGTQRRHSGQEGKPATLRAPSIRLQHEATHSGNGAIASADQTDELRATIKTLRLSAAQRDRQGGATARAGPTGSARLSCMFLDGSTGRAAGM